MNGAGIDSVSLLGSHANVGLSADKPTRNQPPQKPLRAPRPTLLILKNGDAHVGGASATTSFPQN
jgi:hypothetical protein